MQAESVSDKSFLSHRKLASAVLTVWAKLTELMFADSKSKIYKLNENSVKQIKLEKGKVRKEEPPLKILFFSDSFSLVFFSFSYFPS